MGTYLRTVMTSSIYGLIIKTFSFNQSTVTRDAMVAAHRLSATAVDRTTEHWFIISHYLKTGPE